MAAHTVDGELLAAGDGHQVFAVRSGQRGNLDVDVLIGRFSSVDYICSGYLHSRGAVADIADVIGADLQLGGRKPLFEEFLPEIQCFGAGFGVKDRLGSVFVHHFAVGHP